MDKKIITIMITMILIIITFSPVLTSVSIHKKIDRNNLEDISKNIEELNIPVEQLSIESEKLENRLIHKSQTIDSWSVFDSLGNQTHPGFARTEDGIHVASFHDSESDELMYTYSLDEGKSFNSEMVYWQLGGDYPSIKLWEEEQFHGTFVTDSEIFDGGATFLFTCTDPTDYSTYDMQHWNWDEYGWNGMIDADIACNSAKKPWEWGVSAFVMSTNYSHGYTNGPTITFAHPEQEGTAYINFLYMDGCRHCDVDIDRNKQFMYAVFDHKNTSTGFWELLVWKMDLSEPVDSRWIYIIKGEGNLTNPAVAANENNVVILAETDESDNCDIVCYHTDDGNIENFEKDFVVNSPDDEKYPDIRSFEGDNFFSTYFKNNNLFGPLTYDGGKNWEEIIWQINKNNGCVIDEYKTTDLCEGGVLTIWEDGSGDDVDISMGNTLFEYPPKKPTKPSGPTYGFMCLFYEYISYSYDPDFDDFKYGWDWDGDLVADEWTEWLGPNESCKIFHAWQEPGIYNVSVKTKDVYAYESNWSEYLTVKINYLAGKTVHVGGTGEDNYTKIQDAVDNLVDGFSIFVHDDSSPYYENIDVIDKSINIIGENPDTTIIDGCRSGNVVHAVSCNNFNFSGFTIINSGGSTNENNGIFLKNCNNCNISKNILTNNSYYGMKIDGCNNNEVLNNIFYDNEVNFALFHSDNNIISNNDLSRAYDGFYISGASENYFINNYVHGIFHGGIIIIDCSNSHFIRNRIEKSISNAVIIEGDDCKNIDFSYNNIRRNLCGVMIISGINHTFSHNNFIGNLRNVYAFTYNYTFNNNYWNRPMFRPKVIVGKRVFWIREPGTWNRWDPGLWILIPKFVFDMNPAKKPFKI